MRLSRKGRQRLEKKRERKKGLNKIFIGTSLFLFTINPLVVDATTVEDIRYLVGKQKLSEIYTHKEIKEIKIGYKRIESFNNIVDMFNLLKDVDKDIVLMTRKERASLISKINIKKFELENTFNYGGTVTNILKVKSELDNMVFKESILRKEKEVIELKKQPNVYEKDFKKISHIENEIESYKYLGKLPYEIGFPVVNSNYLLGVFGVYEKEGVKYFNNGIDIFGIEGSYVINIFNGVVKEIENLGDNFYRVTIENDKDLKTVYEAKMILSDDIKVGKYLEQRDKIGRLLNMDQDYGYLHFEVILDNKHINPIYLFGNQGKNALKVYQSVVDDSIFQDYSYLLENIKEIEDKDRNTFKPKEKEQNQEQNQEQSKGIEVYMNRLYSLPNPKDEINDEQTP